MTGSALWGVVLLAVVGTGVLDSQLNAQEYVSFAASDGAPVHGYWYRSGSGPAQGVILAFHQGGASGRAEYGPIAPRLNALGYDVLTIDQRAGGDLFGGENRAVAERGESSYCEAAPDLAGTLRFARESHPEAPIILWGSSYSGALVLRLAAADPDGIVGVLAFSPASGGPMVDCRGEDVSGEIQVPMLALRPRSEMEIPSSAAQFEQFREQGHTTFVAEPGAHGSSMLVAERVEAPVDETWEAVIAFLRGLTQ